MPVMLHVVCFDLYLVSASCIMHTSWVMVSYDAGHRVTGHVTGRMIGKASDVRPEEMFEVMHSLCVCMVRLISAAVLSCHIMSTCVYNNRGRLQA